MTELPVTQLYEVTEATWPPAHRVKHGPWIVRTGLGGGSRVSATTAHQAIEQSDLAEAESAMRALGQPNIFMIRDGDGALDRLLDQSGYQIKDPVTLYAVPTSTITAQKPPAAMTFRVWPPLAVEQELWAQGGIGPARLAVMDRVKGAKTSIMGRIGQTPAGVLFVACHAGIAMIHAVEVNPAHRRKGIAQQMILAAGSWAADHGAATLSLVVTQANVGANALYASMGFSVVGQYHYRIKPD